MPVPWSLERWAAAPALELGELKKALCESDTIPQGVDFDRLLRTRSTEERWLVGEVLLEHASRAFPPAALKSLLAGGVSALLGLDRDALAGLLDDFLPPSA